jgi:hypothetical protein
VKIELYIGGAAQAAVFAEFLPKWQAAEREDYKASGNELVAATPVPTPVAEAPAPAPELEPAKKPRGRAAKATEPVAEAAPAIRATPEDRQPVDVEAVEEAEVVEDVFDDAPATVLTREDVKLALAAYAEKFGMAKAQAEGPKLMGAPRLSALPDDQEAFAKAIKALREAVANG